MMKPADESHNSKSHGFDGTNRLSTREQKGDSHEWHEDSRKSFRGNRITCQHIDASVMS